MEKSSDKEIDISDIFRGIKNFFLNIFYGMGRGFVNTVYFIKRYRKIIGALMIFGIIGGLIYSLGGRPYFSSLMVVKSNDRFLEKNVIIKILDELTLMCEEEDYEELSRRLNITPEQAASLRSLELEEEVEITNAASNYSKYFSLLSSIPDEEKQRELLELFMKSERDNIYYIAVSVYDASVLAFLSEPLSKLMNSNPYFVKQRRINDIAYKASEEKIYAELVKLDSLKITLTRAIEKRDENFKSGSNNIILGENQLYNPLPVYEKYISLYSDAISLKKKILFNEETLEVVSGFVKLKKNVRLHPVWAALAGAGGGFAGGIVLILIMLAGQKFNKLELRERQ